MSLYEITNVSDKRVAVSSREYRPLHFSLGPGERIGVLIEDLKRWSQWGKQDLAEYVQKGFLQIEARDTVHVVQDKAHRLPLSTSGRSGATGLTTAVDRANLFKAVYNAHIPSTLFHSVADGVNTITSPDVDPTDTPATQLTDMITLLTEAQLDYDAHRTQAGVHVVDDTTNATALVAPVDLDTCIGVLDELYALFNSHLAWFYDAAAAPLTPVDIITL